LKIFIIQSKFEVGLHTDVGLQVGNWMLIPKICMFIINLPSSEKSQNNQIYQKTSITPYQTHETAQRVDITRGYLF
jgi:hypothetical protein